jgi:undecaprenyl phosphate N,N'-diacetylbacillosamine 1-phosphate transferase
MYLKIVKLSLDFITALLIFLLLLPVFIITMLLLAIANQGNPFYIQKRPGKNEKVFKIIKFKTMNDKKDLKGNLLPDTFRLTALDEIPQLLNVLKGDMSLIGPRPLLPRYLPYYSIEEKIRHDVKPGITGYAQVNGRNYLDWNTKLKYDTYYVKNVSFLLDLQILIKTFIKVLLSKDVSVDTSLQQLPLDEERNNKI